MLGDGCWVLSLYKTILLEEIIPYIWMNLILLTIYAFKTEEPFLLEYYDVEHTLSIDDTVDDLIKVCQKNGGELA